MSASAIAQQKGRRQEECWPGTDQAQQVTFEPLWDLAWNVGDDLRIWAFAGLSYLPSKGMISPFIPVKIRVKND